MTAAERLCFDLYAAGEHDVLYLSYRLNVPLHRVRAVTRDLRRTLPATFRREYVEGISRMGQARERPARR